MKYEIDKQGVEIEIQLADKNIRIAKATDPRIDYAKLGEISGGWHSDDAKVEFSSSPYTDIGDLGVNVASIVSKGMKLISSGVHPITIGCTPFFEDFASGHIHTSIIDMKKKSWIEMRRKLFNAQPLIALLSLNSPVVGSLVAGDVRLLLSKWSRFSDYESTSMDHWMALAYGMDGATLEVRIPSSGPIQQILGILLLIRVILKEDVPSYPILNTKENWNEVINYGSASMTRILLPTSITYHGLKNSECLIRSTDLWKAYLIDNKDNFKTELEKLPSKLRSRVEEFYEYVANGHTLSDGIYQSLMKFKDRSRFIDFLSSMSIGTYCGASIFDYLPKDPPSLYPVAEKYMTLDEFRDLVNKIMAKGFNNIKLYEADYINAVLHEPMILTNIAIRRVMDALSREPIALDKIDREIVNILVKHNIATVNEKLLVQGQQFAPIYYMIRRIVP